MDELGLPILLLASVWGAFSVILKAIEMLSRQRDIILGISDEYSRITTEQKRLIYNHDFKPLLLGTVLFLLVLSLIVIATPYIAAITNPLAVPLGYAVGAFTVFAAITMAVGGIGDIKAMNEHLEKEEKPNQAVQPTAEGGGCPPNV